jgi:hypothetical protein
MQDKKMIRLLKILLIMSFLTLFKTISFSEEKVDCSTINADTGLKMLEKYKCKKKYGKGTSVENKLIKNDSLMARKIKSFTKKIKEKIKN